MKRKKNKKLPLWSKILIIFVSIIIVFIVIGIVGYTNYLYSNRNIISNVYAIRNDRNNIPMVNFFLFRTGEKFIAIDAGSDIIQTQKALNKLNISPNDIIAVFITHFHFDHIDSLSLFENAIIYTGNTENMNCVRCICEFPDIPHQILSEGQIIEINDVKIQVFDTPGHTSSCVTYLINNKYLFVGDLLVSPNMARYDSELQIMNRERMLKIDTVEYVFTGHFGLFKRINMFRRLWL